MEGTTEVVKDWDNRACEFTGRHGCHSYLTGSGGVLLWCPGVPAGRPMETVDGLDGFDV